LGATALAAPLLGVSSAPDEFAPLNRALVLSGGGARGAYEAGIVNALAAVGHVGDGSALAPYEIVCGTSIGALNGWFVATGQYTTLHDLWYGISGQGPYAPETAVCRRARSRERHHQSCGVGRQPHRSGQRPNRFTPERAHLRVDREKRRSKRTAGDALSLGDDQLGRPAARIFLRSPPGVGQNLPERVVHALQLALGPHTVVREATPDILHRAIFASAAIPIAFDPVIMPDAQGHDASYCDGGVASNSPVGIAHSISNGADVVLLDPELSSGEGYKDAVEIAFGVFGTMQRKVLEVEMRNTYFQSIGKRALTSLTPKELGRTAQVLGSTAQFMQSLVETSLRYIRPQSELPLSVAGFNDEVGIGKAYRIGWEDATMRGFKDYDWQTFQL
jgi:predicted acylesterase/phospholipase RssA